MPSTRSRLGCAHERLGDMRRCHGAPMSEWKTRPTSNEPILQVEGLTVDFSTDDGVVHAVRGVTYSLLPGEVLGIVGESGSGKSVSTMAIMGLLPRNAKISGSV